ncbi:MAG: sodium-extruding oxaloacetate decarboxylase subunit alpha [Candidatus Nitrohelix vancouverensis]|uniref:Sodium-extruding oxaloacetate decarboxylase subunit alpha n=1 Tax=Candidatus Nitrohelix vancouverensis TaxID=2705534 RepID=A0A7T0C1P5_9BACT|nr:MAG: sodium-extruding oxaloacetate decarboxylase subunit alpha [Candidatus Nitrohelix vancouverensis]
MTSEKKPLKITETVLRDAHQSLLATRMRTEDMLPIASKIDQVGYFSSEMWGGATFDSCLRFLNENPWDRIRKLKLKMPNTPFQMLLRGQNCVGYRHYADDIVERFVKHSADLGIDIFRIFDALNDFRNIKTAVDTAKKCGKIVEGTISYTVSPVHDLERYVTMARQLEDMGSDILCIKDMAGLLTPKATFDLVSEAKKAVKIPVHLHTHATTGLAGMNLQCAIEADIDIVDTAISSLAMGTSQFATECIVASLRGTERDTGLDMTLLTEIADYFKEVKKHYAEFESDFKGVDVKILDSQIPGGMISNMENQLKEQNALDKLEQVLKEVPRVRKDMGYPPLVTPTSQIVGSQATLNVLTGERYKIVTKETRECVLGKYGKLPAPIDPDLLAKVAQEEEIMECRPADMLEPEWEKVVEECGDKITSEDDHLSYAMFPKVAMNFFAQRDGLIPPPVEKKPGAKSAPAVAAPAAAPVAYASGPAAYTVMVNGKSFAVEVIPAGSSASAVATAPQPAAAVATAPAPSAGAKETLEAPLPGSIYSLKCKVGDAVNAGDVLIIMEAMKMETDVTAHTSGTIGAILIKEGDKVQTGDPLIEIN